MAQAMTIEGSLTATDDESGEDSPAIAAIIAARETSGASHAYLVLSLVLGTLVAITSVGELAHAELLGLVGITTLGALGSAVLRLRAQDAPTWETAQRGPFLVLGAAVAVMALTHASAWVDLEGTADSAWVIGSIGAALGAIAFLLMIHDLTPARAVDSLYLVAIGATVVGLTAWIAVTQRYDAEVISAVHAFELLLPAVLGLVAVALGVEALRLRSSARQGCRLLIAAWGVLFAVEAGELLAEITQTTGERSITAGGVIVAFGLIGAAALHRDSTHPVELLLGPIARLPRSQVVVLAGAVVLGPVTFALGLDEPGTRTVILVLSAALSLLVVAHLVRLVQGRAALEHRAHHDELTGLANRALFADRASVALAHARRTNGHSAVLFLDLDRFKKVNDSLGHSVGNLLLQAVAKRLRNATRAEDTVARLGGDEFVVLLPQLGDPEEAAAVASKILDDFGGPFSLNDHRLFASPSIGIAVFPGDGDDADALLRNADTAMYRAKQRGRRTFCAYDHSMNDHAHERLALESRLHTAVDKGELRLHYQPKVHLPTGRVTGMEALLRWQHPDLGLLEPVEFISLAEDSGLIIPLGEWALEEACRQNQAWRDAGFAPLVVAVNLSLRQFQQQRIEDVTARILRSTGLDPALLELEVTESLAMQDPEAVRSTLLDLREMGVTCSIDDFGTGYSGLSYLTRFPVDKLKIDKSFVATIDTDREAPIVVAVVALAHGLGLGVVAEGVETAGQLERLRELGCDEMQGFLFSRPLTAEGFEQLLMLESISPGPGRLVVPHAAPLCLVPAVR